MQVRQQQLQPDDRSPQHVGPEEASKTAPIMPIPLPEVAMELPGHSHSITSNGLGDSSLALLWMSPSLSAAISIDPSYF